MTDAPGPRKLFGVAFMRGIARERSSTLGNFWVDVVRGLLWVLIPLSILGGLFLVWQGVPVNNLPYLAATTVEEQAEVYNSKIRHKIWTPWLRWFLSRSVTLSIRGRLRIRGSASRPSQARKPHTMPVCGPLLPLANGATLPRVRTACRF